jgi:hypothetical protein
VNHVFVSHSHEDADFAENLQNRLRQAEFTVWTDANIAAGQQWRTEIDNAIKAASALIIVITPDSKASEYVTYEWGFAWGAGIKLVPVLLKKTEIHPRLESLQYLDFTNRITRPWDKLIELLREAEESKPQDEKPAPEVRIDDRRNRAAYKRMIAALNDIGWTWRSIERLAAIGGVTENEASDILRPDPNVVFGKGKSGRTIARVKTKVL